MVDWQTEMVENSGANSRKGLNRSREDDWHDFGAEHRERNAVNRRVGQTICVIMAAIALLVAAGCSGEPLSTREKGTLIGGGAGAATGAIIGAAVGAPGAGAAIGGAIGGIGGFAVGNAMQNNENQQRQTQSQISSQQEQIERQQQEINSLKQQNETE
jgi:TolA-binding protein